MEIIALYNKKTAIIISTFAFESSNRLLARKRKKKWHVIIN